MFLCNCQTNAGKKQSWRAVGLGRPGKVGRAFSSWYQSVTVPNWKLQKYNPVRLDPVFTMAIVRDPFCSQLVEQKLLCTQSLALVLCWLLTHDKRLFQIYSGSYSSWPKNHNFPAEISPFSFPDYDDRLSWTLLADQKTYGIAIGWLPIDLHCDCE